MEAKEFIQIRHYLGKTQVQIAQLLCVSPKGIQSFEQGLRSISTSVERQLLFLLSLERASDYRVGHCWEITGCPDEWRKDCAAWEFRAGHFCWFINGTFCQGKANESWAKKIQLCKQCEVFQYLITE